MTDPLPIFTNLRSRLFGIAYRMLGVRADAEDILQDAWLRWRAADHASLQSPEAWLVTVVTRLAIDRLRVAKTEREAYVGAWLPEPIVALDEQTPEALAELASDLSVAFLHLLERLGPEERAAFLLRMVFDYDYGEVAEMLGKREPAVRQMVHRAAERVREGRPRFTVAPEKHRELLQKFIAAAQSGHRAAIRDLLAEDVTTLGDGGGKGHLGAGRASRSGSCHQSVLGARVALWPAHDLPPGHHQWRAGPAALPGRPAGIRQCSGDGRRADRRDLWRAQSGQAGEHRRVIFPGGLSQGAGWDV